jgi:FixJ family two-component response regulator
MGLVASRWYPSALEIRMGFVDFMEKPMSLRESYSSLKWIWATVQCRDTSIPSVHLPNASLAEFLARCQQVVDDLRDI